MNRRHFLALAISAPLTAQALPFDREIICRLSLDPLPRSLSIRQGTNVWLGYDLQRATVCKIWQAPANKPGLIKAGFVTRSAGTTWFEDATDDKWELRRGDQTQPLKIRYLGCSHREQHVDLSWELQHDAGVLTLHERIPLSAAPSTGRVTRELRVQTLAEGESLLPPASVRKAWKLVAEQGLGATAITGTAVHRLTLP